jgi:hypothetical protein
MVWRKWLVRLLVFSIVAFVAVAAAIYQHFTNSTAVREQVIARLEEHLPGARVQVESANLNLMAYITFQDLRLNRKDDASQTVFLDVPNGTIYHDKEQLLDGKVAIRKVEFDKPWLRVVREKNGSWNLNGILGAVDLSKSIPTIVLKQATVYLEDHKTIPPVPPLQIKDVNLSIVNDPRDTLVFKGSGLCDLIGTIEISGSLGRATDQFSLSLHMPDVPVAGELIQRLAGYQQEAASHLRLLTGKLKNLHCDLVYDPITNPTWSYDLHGKFTDGRLAHAQLPMMLEQVEGDISMVNGRLSLKKITAHFEETRIELAGAVVATREGFDVEEGMLTVSRLVIDEALMKHLPEQVEHLNQLFRPRGPISFYVEAERHAGRWKTRTHVEPEGMRAACQKFPYELDNIRGTVEQESDPEHDVNLVKIDLVGHSGAHVVTVRGKMGEKGPESVAVHVAAKNLPLDAKMHAALLEHQSIVDSFQPRGVVDVDVDVVRQPYAKEFQNRIIACFHDTTVSYDLFPYQIENVRGVLEILPDHWEFHDFVGLHKEGRFRARGGSFPVPGSGEHELRIDLEGDQIRLDEQMEAALKQPALKQTWSALNPSGHIEFEAHVTQKRKQDPAEIVVSVKPQAGCRIQPAVFPYAMDIAFGPKGQVKYENRHVYLNQILCQHGATMLSLQEGNVTCKENGGLSIDLAELVGNPVIPDGEMVAALPGALGNAVRILELREPLSMRLIRLTVDVAAEGEKPTIYWDGSIGLRNAFVRAGVPFEQVSGVISCKGEFKDRLGPVEGHVRIDQATLFKQPFDLIQTNYTVNVVQPNVVVLPDLNAHLYGGDVGGVVRIDLDKNLAYELNLRASQVQLEAFSKQNQIGTRTQLSGLATASLYLRGSGTDLKNLQGHGAADVMNGKIYNLPPIVQLLKVLKLRFPDETAFEEAHIQFGIAGRQMELTRLDFFGDAVSLGGKGKMNLDGTNLMVDCFALPGPLNARFLPVIGNLEAAISKQIVVIKMRGSLMDPKCFSEPVPVVLEPLKGMMNWVRNRNGAPPRE